MDFAQQLKSSIDIVQVVGERVRLKKAGTRWVGLCPFHNEKSPSFGVNPNLQIYKCFGCGEGGGVIDFVMKFDNLTFWEACKELAERYGIPIPKRAGDTDEATKLRAGLHEMNEIAFKTFRDALRGPAGATARGYIAGRGVRPDVLEEFGIGYAEAGGQTLLRKLQQAGFGPAPLRSSGLVSERQDGSGFFDRFRNRLIFPIHSESGKIAGFAGRALSDEDNPKYLNSPETEFYKKSFILYNLHRAKKSLRQQDQAILVEGYMDVIGLHGGGIPEAVASCGTSLVNTQVQLIHRNTQNLVVNFDPDAAGVKATERTIGMMHEFLDLGMRVRVLALPGNLDPDEFILANGGEAFRQLLKKAPSFYTWLVEQARKRFDLRSADGKMQAVNFVLPSVRRISSKIERSVAADELAQPLGIDKSLILEQLRGFNRDEPATARIARGLEAPKVELLLLQNMLSSEAARRYALGRLKNVSFARPPVTQRILAAFQSLGEEFRYEALEARLDDKERNLLSSLVFADDRREHLERDEEGLVAQVQHCLDRLELGNGEAAIQDLKARIMAAEREGRLQEAISLSQELQGLGDSRRPPRPGGEL